MARFSMPDTALNKSDLLDNTLEDHSLGSSTIPGSEVDPGGVPPGNSGNAYGSVAGVTDSVAGSVEEELVDNGGRARSGILRGKWAKEKTAGATIQAPSHDYRQQYPHGYPVSGYPPGMMPMQPVMAPPGMMPPGIMHPGMMPMQLGGVMPGRMPDMMPPHYDCAPYRGGCYDYACGHPDIQTVTVESSRGCDYSLSTNSESSCTRILCTEPCQGLANLVLSTVDSFKRSVDVVMDYGEELLDPPTISGDNSVRSRLSCLTLPARSTPEDHAELLEKIDKLYKLVTEKEASGKAIVKTKDLNPLEALNESAISHRSGSGLIGVDHCKKILSDANNNAPGDAAKAKKGVDNVEESTSLFSDYQLSTDRNINKVTSIQKETGVNETVETEAVFTESKKKLTKLRLGRSRSRERLMKYVPVKTSQAKKEKVTIQKEHAVDSMGFPIATSNENHFHALSWGSDFSSGNPFAGEHINVGSSPVSVTTSLQPSCAWCGLGGSNTKDVKKLKLCSACQSTYYCSSECQSKDWINGHFETCQIVANVD